VQSRSKLCKAGNGCNSQDPKDGRKIQGPGAMTIAENSIVFVTDKTVKGDKAAAMEEDSPTGTPVLNGKSIKSWQNVIDKLTTKAD